MIRAFVTAVMLLIGMVSTVQAEFHDGDYDVQAWCVTGPDSRFDDGIVGFTNSPDVNDQPHVHVGNLIKDGNIPNREALYNQAFIFTGVWSVENGQQHFNAYVPKDAVLERTTCPKASQFQPDERRREYVEDVDFEKATNDGLGSSGSTPTHTGRRRGSE